MKLRISWTRQFDSSFRQNPKFRYQMRVIRRSCLLSRERECDDDIVRVMPIYAYNDVPCMFIIIMNFIENYFIDKLMFVVCNQNTQAYCVIRKTSQHGHHIFDSWKRVYNIYMAFAFSFILLSPLKLCRQYIFF